MEWYFILLILIAYGVGEFIIGFFFNYKIFMISKENFRVAAFMGAISTILYAILISSSAFIAGTSLDGAYWFVVVSAFTMGIGNFFAAILVPVISKKLGHFKNEEENKIIVEELKSEENH
ncbi:MAG: hypothetical protein HPAVJP_4060 [Candidatus Hepatoplasma vulgare]|nr:MAG: hypothetical protein HPAVJP_4060 [Candidatus Hepatoplasma sp.]